MSTQCVVTPRKIPEDPKELLQLDSLATRLHDTLVALFFNIETCGMPSRMASCSHHAGQLLNMEPRGVWYVRGAWVRPTDVEHAWPTLTKGEEGVSYSACPITEV